MKVLFDTNVIIDAVTLRDYEYKDSQELIRYVLQGKIVGVIAAKQVTDIYYILRKYVDNVNKRKEIIRLMLDSFEVIPTLKSDLSYCLNSEISDYEDAVLDEIAKVNCIDYIVTNNVTDFSSSKTVIFEPKQLKLLIGSTS